MEDKFTMEMNGQMIECSIIDTFYSTEFHKGYVIYVDGSLDENGLENVFASCFDIDHEDQLMEIETNEEWEMIQKVLEEMKEED